MLAPFLGVAVCVLGVLALATFFEIGPNNVLRWEHSVISSAPVSPEAVLHAGQNAVLAQSAICGGNAEDEHQLLTLYRRGNADNAQMSAFYMHMMANGALPLDPNEHVQAIENRDDLVRVQPISPFGTNTTCWILGTDKHLFNRIE